VRRAVAAGRPGARGLGVALAVVVLAGCGGGRSDEEKVAALAQQLQTASEHRDGRKLCRELLHPNSVRAYDRLARAESPPGTPPLTCERRLSRGGIGQAAGAGRVAKPDEVTIKGDVAYVPSGAPGAKRPFARRVDGAWKFDLTVDPVLRWALRASFACERWQDAVQGSPLPAANRAGVIKHLQASGDGVDDFLRAIDVDAATGEEKEPAHQIEGALLRLTLRIHAAGVALAQGVSFEALRRKQGRAILAAEASVLRALRGASVQCGRIPSQAPDGAEFRRKATAVCTPLTATLQDLGEPGSSARSVMRFLRRGGALERRARTRLARLEPPSDLDRVYRDTLATLDDLGATLRRESAAVARRDLAGLRRVVARFGPLDYRKSAGFARLGVPACGGL
jgi:hypothetical protein